MPFFNVFGNNNQKYDEKWQYLQTIFFFLTSSSMKSHMIQPIQLTSDPPSGINFYDILFTLK